MKIVVLAGGLSTEREVSLVTGSSVCRALRENGHRAILVDLFLGIEDAPADLNALFDAPDGLIPAAEIKVTAPDLDAVRAQRKDQSRRLFGPNVLELCSLADIVFLGLHGQDGEDGRVQATFDLLDIKYTGGGYLASGMAMDKSVTKRMMDSAGIPTAPWRDIPAYTEADISALTAELEVPCVVKVVNGGSSIGVALPDTKAELETALGEMLCYGSHVIVEKKIYGREFTVGVLGDRALPAVEIVPAEKDFDYIAKYQTGGAQEICPAPITAEQQEEMGALALKLHRTLGLSVYSRTDFLLDEEGKFWCLEVNSLPGMTAASLVPKEAAAIGMTYNELCEEIVQQSYRLQKMSAPRRMEVLMQPMTIQKIAAAVKGVWWNPREDAPEVTAVCTDSRKLTPGCLFVPWVGEKFDGHNFIDAALDAGAAGCLCAKVPAALRSDKFYIQVPDTRLALRALASAYRDQFDIPFVQVTGSVGKTTTKEMIAAVLGAKWPVLKTPENFNNDIGTPLTLFGLNVDHRAAVIETGMNHFGEIEYLGEMVRPDIAVISNVGDAHIEFLGSREGILKAKCEIFAHLKEGGLAILNGDDPLLDTVQVPFRTLRCGKAAHCQVRVTDVADHGVEGITCTVTTEQDTYKLSIPAPGEHMVYSASMAVAVGEALGLSHDEIVRGVAAYEPAGARMRVVRLHGGRVILDDCYNANPQSVTAALEVLAKTDCDRKVAVLGDMGELGDLTDQAHYNVGALAAMLGIDCVVAIGEKAAKIADGAAQGGGAVIHFLTKEEAIGTLREQLGPNTAMLVKASHAMHFGALVDQLREEYD